MSVAAANKIVRGDDLTTVAGEIDKHFQRKVNGKGLSTNDYTTEEKNKLAGIAAGAEANVNADWNAESGDALILNKPSIPSKTSELTNDSGFVTTTQVDTAIANALKGGYVVVNPLPTASADTLGKIYLVPMTDTEDSNVKEEYVTWLDGSTYKWEKLGTTQFDNSDYEERLTAAEITTLLDL